MEGFAECVQERPLDRLVAQVAHLGELVVKATLAVGLPFLGDESLERVLALSADKALWMPRGVKGVHAGPLDRHPALLARG